ncbi:MAG: glycoside hydrolase family 15 protein [Actinomycetota bacterium]
MKQNTASDQLLATSVRVILHGQAPSGAYVASPNFPNYRFAWLRDGSFCALAMDAVGESDSAAAFHGWVATVVERLAPRIRSIIEELASGADPAQIEMLPTRYTLDGLPEADQEEVWPNFQLDGYGAWLFALESHYGHDVPAWISRAAGVVADYLVAGWTLPCYDYWEEFGDRQHTSTLGAIAAGLRAAARYLSRRDLAEVADTIVETIESTCVVADVLVKGPDDTRLDASLLSLSTPFGLYEPADAVMRATVEGIRSDLLSPSGGVRRYVGDTFYGGNPWLMLTAWLGWHSRRDSDVEGYLAASAWVTARAGDDGMLAEQVLDEPQEPELVGYWEQKWGPVADPLLWSHAMYILMTTESESAA